MLLVAALATSSSLFRLQASCRQPFAKVLILSRTQLRVLQFPHRGQKSLVSHRTSEIGSAVFGTDYPTV